MVAVGLDPKNSSSAGEALNHCATGGPPGKVGILTKTLQVCKVGSGIRVKIG